MKLHAMLVLAALALLPVAYAIDYTGTDSVCWNEGYANFNWVFMAFALTVFLISFAYMLSKVFESPEMGVWAHDELFNLGVSVVLFAVLVGCFIASCEIVQGFSGGMSPFAATYNYLDGIAGNGLNALRDLTKSSLQNQLDATSYLNIGWPASDARGVATKASLRAVSSHKEMVIDLALPLLASIRAQKTVLQILELVSLSVILPFAMVLRILPFTREGGNLLIALSFAMYVVLPAFYALSAEAWKEVVERPWGVSVFNYRDWGLDAGAACPAGDCVLFRIGSMIPQAVFLPNLALIMLITCTMAISKGLRQLSA
jgi:hypothetical protein